MQVSGACPRQEGRTEGAQGRRGLCAKRASHAWKTPPGVLLPHFPDAEVETQGVRSWPSSGVSSGLSVTTQVTPRAAEGETKAPESRLAQSSLTPFLSLHRAEPVGTEGTRRAGFCLLPSL